MAKNVLKAWLVDNTVTTDDKTDKIFQLETTRSIDKEIILDRMVAKNPGVRRETMALGIEMCIRDSASPIPVPEAWCLPFA